MLLLIAGVAISGSGGAVYGSGSFALIATLLPLIATALSLIRFMPALLVAVLPSSNSGRAIPDRGDAVFR